VLIILVDSLYFNSISVWELLASDQPLQLLLSMKVHITPWNHMRYNMDHDNLADHGLHPHYLHALVNAPLLFGPLYLLSLYTMARDVLNKRHLTPLRMACLASFLMGLVALSLFPHQEARFLLPLLGVMLLWLQLHLEGLSRRFYWWWIVFNLLTMLHFGVLHQAGVVPSLLWLSNHIKEPSQVHYWKTFMPPRHLLFAANGTSMSIVDHAGKSMEAMDILTACSPSHALYLVTPHVVQHTAFSQVHTVWPHVGFVDPLELLQHPIQSTSLYIYHIHCP
jgi:phosphatidylinositol glycan class Z